MAALTRKEALERIQSTVWLLGDYMEECNSDNDRIIMLSVLDAELKKLKKRHIRGKGRKALIKFLVDMPNEYAEWLNLDHSQVAKRLVSMALAFEDKGEHIDAKECRELAELLRSEIT